MVFISTMIIIIILKNIWMLHNANKGPHEKIKNWKNFRTDYSYTTMEVCFQIPSFLDFFF